MAPRLQCGHTVLHSGCEICLALEATWYGKLQLQGFEDIEAIAIPGRPLKKWTGVSIQIVPRHGDEPIDVLDAIVSQSPGEGFQNAFPENPVSSHERLLHHPEFDALCSQICGHYNHTGTPRQVKDIWERYIEGNSKRSIASALGINDTFVWRTIHTLTQWMELMDLDETQDAPLAKVVLREYRPKGIYGDEGFIYATWRNALWFDKDGRKEGDSDRFYREATHSIREILKDPDARVRIACLDDSDILIVGYSVSIGDCLHFIYVKPDYRNRGIANLLLPKDITSVSPTMTKVGRAIAIKKNLI